MQERLSKKQGQRKNRDNYYPFGLTFNSYQRVTAKENRYLYNQGIGDIQFKTERITDLDLNLDMTKYRMYDYATGRFTQVDPLADANPQESLTPYQYLLIIRFVTVILMVIVLHGFAAL